MFEAKTIIKYSSLETGCDLCLQRLSYKSIENYLKKYKAQKPKFILENSFFQNSQQSHHYSKKRFEFQNIRKPIEAVNNEINSQAH